MDFVFMPCYHCDRPWCVAACPTGAMQKRAKDGIVFVDHDLCVGCKACMRACPWGAPQWDPEKGKVVKCDYCMDRVDQGLEPACVAKCVTKCLHFGKAGRNDRRPQGAPRQGHGRHGHGSDLEAACGRSEGKTHEAEKKTGSALQPKGRSRH